jgi:hypothetical protein
VIIIGSNFTPSSFCTRQYADLPTKIDHAFFLFRLWLIDYEYGIGLLRSSRMMMMIIIVINYWYYNNWPLFPCDYMWVNLEQPANNRLVLLSVELQDKNWLQNGLKLRILITAVFATNYWGKPRNSVLSEFGFALKFFRIIVIPISTPKIY